MSEVLENIAIRFQYIPKAIFRLLRMKKTQVQGLEFSTSWFDPTYTGKGLAMTDLAHLPDINKTWEEKSITLENILGTRKEKFTYKRRSHPIWMENLPREKTVVALYNQNNQPVGNIALYTSKYEKKELDDTIKSYFQKKYHEIEVFTTQPSPTRALKRFIYSMSGALGVGAVLQTVLPGATEYIVPLLVMGGLAGLSLSVVAESTMFSRYPGLKKKTVGRAAKQSARLYANGDDEYLYADTGCNDISYRLRYSDDIFGRRTKNIELVEGGMQFYRSEKEIDAN